MAYLKNPEIEVKIFGDETFSFTGEFMSFDVEKDLEEEPNEATIEISNLNVETRNKIASASEQESPIELWASTDSASELTLAFRGEIDVVNSSSSLPGIELTISATSQKINHRALYIDEKTFEGGTRHGDIIMELVSIIGLPVDVIDDLPATKLILSQSFTGPAFRILQRYAFDLGMYVYIVDGKISVTSMYSPQSPTILNINNDQLLEAPFITKRLDSEFVEMQTIVESSGLSPFDKKTRPKKTRKVKIGRGKYIRVKNRISEIGENDYVEYEAVDTTIDGMNFVSRLLPSVQPDNLVSSDSTGDKLYRVKRVYHYGNSENFDEWTTELETDNYNGSDTAF